MGILHIKGIECYAYHGCLAEERKIGQLYRIDLSFDADFSKAISGDSLSDAIDYVVVKEIVLREMRTPSNLIEHVAARILKSCVASFPACNQITVRLIKYNPPVNGVIKETVIELNKSDLT